MERKQLVKRKLSTLTTMLEGEPTRIRALSLEEAKANLRRNDPGLNLASALPLFNEGRYEAGSLLLFLDNIAFPLIRTLIAKK